MNLGHLQKGLRFTSSHLLPFLPFFLRGKAQRGRTRVVPSILIVVVSGCRLVCLDYSQPWDHSNTANEASSSPAFLIEFAIIIVLVLSSNTERLSHLTWFSSRKRINHGLGMHSIYLLIASCCHCRARHERVSGPATFSLSTRARWPPRPRWPSAARPRWKRRRCRRRPGSPS